jgi:hypothetical protein
MNQKRGDEALAELFTTTFWVPRNMNGWREILSPELSLEFVRESNFDELVMEAYGCELS